MNPEDVLTFWREAGPKQWFEKDLAFDEKVLATFLPTYEAAASGGLDAWREQPASALALIIILDQFPRNMFRGARQMFATDSRARELADHAITRGFDQQMSKDLRSFFYLPLMHSEAPADQERCVALFEALGDENGLRFAKIHEDIIRRFGRFPHRNSVLGRDPSPEEQAFLDKGGFAG